MRRVFTLIFLLLFVAYLGVTIYFADKEHKAVTCCGVEICVNKVKMNSLIDTLTVSRLISKNFGNFNGRLIHEIDIDTIVRYLKRVEQVKDAGVYFSQQGKMYVVIEQHEPLFRVYPNIGASYAIDESGQVMPLRGAAAFRSVVVTGNVTKTMAMGEILSLVKYINNDKLWRAMFEQIHVDEQGDYLLVPNAVDFKIRLGSLSDLDLKFDNLRLYLEQGVEKRGWGAYKEINLKFTNQVIGVKR